MIDSIKRISLDIHDASSRETVTVKRGDTGRKIHVVLVDGGLPYHISEECYAVFTATKPDGNIVFNSCTIEDNVIIYKLTPQTVAAIGLAKVEIKLYGADDNLITSPSFNLIVENTVYNEGDEIESEAEVEALTHLISEATTAIYDSEQTTAAGKELIEDLEISRDEFEEKVFAARISAEAAKASEDAALASRKAAETAEKNAATSAGNASTSEQAAKDSATASAGSAAASQKSSEEAEASADEAKISEENAKNYADTIDTEQINANIATKADDLYFDSGTSLLYLMSEGQIIGTGVQVATTGGGGGGTLTYTIAMKNLLDSRVMIVPEGKKVELKFSYASVDEEGIDDGPGIGKIIVGNATRQAFTAVQGDNTVDVTSYLVAGSNTVKVQVENSEGAKKTLPYTVTVAAAYMTSAFDASAPFTGDIPFIYTPTGIAEKTVHFELDGTEIGSTVVTASGRQQSYTIPAQSHGAHSLRAWFECEIEGTTVTSNVISFAIICIEEGVTTKIIAVEQSLITSVEQYTNIVTKYRVYDPTSLTAAITLEANGNTVSSLTVDRTEQTWNYRPMEVGELVQTIRCGDEYVSWAKTVTESTIKVEAETEALALHLSSYGRSNNEENPGVWESGNVACEFQNFNFASDGWVNDEDENTVLRVTGDARLHIPYKMFAYDFRTTGKTIEFELATREVLNYDAEVINCFSGERGFTITAQQLRLASEQSQLGTRYKEDEHIRVTFVVEKKSANRLILCYINGITSGAAQYPEDDDFSQTDPVGITIGSNDCTTDIYNIRVYDNNLTRFQILDNWIADTQNPEDRLNRYLRNQIYDAYGRIVISQLPTNLCYLVLQCSSLPQYKGDKKTCSGYFVDLIHPERSFTFENAEIDVQGTSSQYYWRKNYKIEFKGGFILYDGSTVTVYAMNDDAVPVSVFTMKADVASSEGYYNVVSAKLYNKYHPFKTPAQEADPRVRHSIDGFPIVIFWDNGTDVTFLGKYNFNNDKGTSEPFGLFEGDERWEVLQNGTARVGFHSADFSDDSWKEDFEGNYPDGSTDLTNLKPMCEWVTSTDTEQATGETIDAVTYDEVEYTADTAEFRLAKFSAELDEHFVEQAVIYYKVFTDIFLCMDQREKNVLWRFIDSLKKWLADYYDADSIIGHNNQAQPVFDYWMEDIDYTASGDPVFNGQNSTFWKNLQATQSEEIKTEYQRLRDEGLSYESVMAEIEEHKSKWPEAIYNEDMQCKCLDALEQNGDGTYLPFLRGDKWAWTQWWLYNRFRYLDSLHEYGTSVENRATIRTNVMENLHLTYYMKMYGNVYYNAEHVVLRVEKDTEYEFVSHASGAEDRVIGINDADMITSLGDLAPHMVELIDLSKMIHLKTLKLGDASADYVNNALTSVTFGNNTLLRIVDMRNCSALTQAPDLSGCTNIEEAYFDGTAITGVTLPNGGILKVLHLPETIANLTIRNQKALTELVLPSYSNITTLRLENNGAAIDPLPILAEMPDNSRVRIIDFSYEADTGKEVADFITRLNTMRGLDENGNNTDNAQVSGSIHAGVVNPAHLEIFTAAMATYPSLEITYDEVRNFIVRFHNGDTLLETVEDVVYGSSVAYSGSTPTKLDADVPEDWRFAIWSPDPTYVTDDMDCYAQFSYVGYKALKLVERTISGDYENDRVDIIGLHAFYRVDKLDSVTFQEVTDISSSAFANSTLTYANFPNAASIGSFAFQNCSKMEYIIAPKVTYISSYAFQGCSKMKSFNFPLLGKVSGWTFHTCSSLQTVSLLQANSVDTIAFYSCSSLTAVDLHKVTSIQSQAFTKCTALETVILRNSETVCSLGAADVFSDTPIASGTGYIYVPSALKTQYAEATNWSTYASQIRAIEDYPDICGGE